MLGVRARNPMKEMKKSCQETHKRAQYTRLHMGTMKGDQTKEPVRRKQKREKNNSSENMQAD